eukprot:6208663-Pleurochrysis_carterae.AAC.4
MPRGAGRAVRVLWLAPCLRCRRPQRPALSRTARARLPRPPPEAQPTRGVDSWLLRRWVR